MSEKVRRQQRFALLKGAMLLSRAERKARTETVRRRKKIKFELNVSNPDDNALDKLLFELRGQGLMTPYIRNGVALYTSLKDGENLDLLFSMFGWVKEIISPQSDAMLVLAEQMKIMERMMLDSGHQQISFSKRLTLLDDDDDFDTEPLRVATKEKMGDGDSVTNFLNAFGEV